MLDREAGRPTPDAVTSQDVTRSRPIAGHEITRPAHVVAGMHGHAAALEATQLAPIDAPERHEGIDPPPEALLSGSGQAAAAPAEPIGAQFDPIGGLIREGRHREAVAACARDHGAVLGRLCMALLGSQADADEAAQETLLRAHRGMASYRGEGSVKSWLCGIARHVCAHVLETRRRGLDAAEHAATDDDTTHHHIHDGHAVLASHRRARAIRAALDQLRPSEREALVLRYVADLSHRDIATALQIDEAAARKRLSRALGQLRAVMCDQEID
jgi:RNA polymerase sigma-70 factor (ECF subfamily)